MAAKMKLKDKILNKQNIFNSIFCLESYVFEKGLLDTNKPVEYCDSDGTIKKIANNDLELYAALADKHNMVLIEKLIGCCHEKLTKVLEDKEHLFEARVYFKVKNYDEGVLNFRPMHTARLTDLICMVSILNCLMFDDDFEKGERYLSDLSKLLPHNFYGNIPSTDVQYLFHKWQNKYKEYTQDVIEHCRAYQENHRYLTEVCLDIQNFFPSISPKMLYNYIVNKLSATYEDDIDVLKMAVAKLLFFKLRADNIEPWKDYYYPKDANIGENDFYLNRGIPQGLPQSYFFGNLCMIEVKRHLVKKERFNGDAYFYVDDSVIFIQSGLTAETFKKIIESLNEDLSDWCNESDKVASDIEQYVTKDYMEFHGKMEYKIKFHENGKSVFTPIDQTDNQYGPISVISRETSMISKLSYNLDEIDDHVSLKKLEAFDEVISREIMKVTEKKEKNEQAGETNDKLSSRLKLLKRFKKFFLYRNRLLKMRDEGGPEDNMANDFRKRCLNRDTGIKEWFEHFDEDIFQAEYRLLIQKLIKSEAEKLREDIDAFEINFLKKAGVDVNGKKEYLYYTKDAQGAVLMKSMVRDIYSSLVKWSHENFSGLKNMKPEMQMKKFKEFLLQCLKEENTGKEGIFQMKEMGFENKDFTRFVMRSSAEYQRRILNVYFSEIMDVLPSDALTFTKMNSRKFRYTELRILAFLRNKVFELEEFEEFVEHINDKDISNCMGIDMGLLEVLNVFINNVKKPEWVDTLIMTHRLTKGLWYNGSKFLNSYTLHNEEHAVTLITRSLELTNRIDYFILKDIDYYILFLACYLHDISMVIHPDLGRLSSDKGKNVALISDLMNRMQEAVESFDNVDATDKKNSRIKNAGMFLVDVFNEVYGYFESVVRDNHAKDSARFIREQSDTLLSYLRPTLLSFVAKVSESHGYDVMDVYGLKSRAKDDTISLKYLMILIRLADLMDVANDRVNYHLLRQNLKHLSLTSRFHWISHLVTSRIELKTEYKADKDKDIGNQPIEEIINLNLYLNFKQLTVAEDNNKKCRGCQCKKETDCLAIRIKGFGETDCCNEKQCTVLCRWMMKKHEWLIPELVSLNDYLFSVNNSLFRTAINFNIYYADDMALDPDMFDSVQDYLEL